MLEIDGLDVAYDGVPAVRDADLSVPAGAVVAVLGPSGCGKSTLLRAVAGLEPPTAGRISFDGADLAGVPTHRRGFALMFQDGQLFPHLTVARNVAYALRLRRARGVEERVAQLLVLVGLEGYDARLPATLSGGERQRVALARSLAAEPRLLLLDEPLSSLDAGLRERLAGDLRRILHEAGTTTLLVTHDHDEAYAVADHLVVMREGRVVQSGEVADVWASPVDAETAVFLGYAHVLDGPAAELLLAAADLPPRATASTSIPTLALRRSALTVRVGGPIAATVLAARATPDQVRLVVRVPGVGELDAVAPSLGHLAPGDDVRLALDPERVAVIPDGP